MNMRNFFAKCATIIFGFCCIHLCSIIITTLVYVVMCVFTDVAFGGNFLVAYIRDAIIDGFVIATYLYMAHKSK